MSEIKKNDIIESGVASEFDEIATSMANVVNEIDKVISSGEELSGVLKKQVTSQKAVNEANAKATANSKKLTTTVERFNTVQKLSLEGSKKYAQNLTKLNTQKTKATKLTKEQIKLNNSAKDSYNAIDAQLKKNIADYNKLSQAQRNNKKVGGAMLTNIKQQDAALKKMDKTMGKSQRHVGNYGKALGGLKNLLGVAGVAGAAMMFMNAIKSSIKTVLDFSRANSKLAAVLGTTKNNIKDLTEDAKRLGTITKYTAVEISNLQVEYAKLGFSKKEIIKLTEATLSLAAASGSDLANAASIAGGTMRAFGITSAESTMVTDVMAKAFSSSALDIEKFSIAMRTAGPVAKTAGVSLQKATAQVGTLANANIDASSAGTALRNIYLRLAKSGMTYDEAMQQIAKSTNKNATAMDLFGVKSATAAIILSDSAVSTNELADALVNSEGAAKQMADTMEDNVLGDVTKLGSAWDGWILSLDNGDSVIGSLVRGALQELADLFITLSDGIISVRDANNKSSIKLVKDNEIENVKEYKKYIEGLKTSMAEYGEELDVDSAKESFLATSKRGIARYTAELSLMKQKLNANSDLSDSEKKSYLEQMIQLRTRINLEKGRIADIENYSKEQKKANDAMKEENDKVIQEEKKKNAKIVEANKKKNAKIEKDNLELGIKNEKNYTTEQENINKENEKFLNDRLAKLKENNDKELLSIKHRYAEGKISAEQAATEIDTLKTNQVKAQIKGLEDILFSQKLTDEQRLEISKQLTDARLLLTDAEIQKNEDATQKTILNDQKLLDSKLQAYQKVQEGMNALHDLQVALTEQEISDNEKNRKKELKAAGDNEKKKLQINEKFDRKNASIKRKQAVADKAVAALNIGLSTAQAVMKSYAQAGPFGGIPGALLVAALGAIQLGTVLAKPIPAFEKGVTDFEGGLATVSDGAGDEIVQTPKGMFLAKGEQTLNLPKHSNVFTAEETKRMISPKLSLEDKKDMDIMLLQAEIQTLTKVVANKDEFKVNITNRGIEILKGSNNRKEKWLNNLIN